MGTLGWKRLQTHLLRSHLDVVVGGGDNNIFRGKVSHVHGKLIGIPEGLDVALAPRTGCGQSCYKLGTQQALNHKPRSLFFSWGNEWLSQTTTPLLTLATHLVCVCGGECLGVSLTLFNMSLCMKVPPFAILSRPRSSEGPATPQPQPALQGSR